MNIEQAKRKLEALKEEHLRAKANMSAAKERLAELGYDTPESAEQTLKELKKQISKEQKLIEDRLMELEVKYPNL